MGGVSLGAPLLVGLARYMTCRQPFKQLLASSGGAVVCSACKSVLGAEAVLDAATDVLAVRLEPVKLGQTSGIPRDYYIGLGLGNDDGSHSERSALQRRRDAQA